MSKKNSNKKLIRITTVPMALRYLLPGQMRFMASNGFDVLMISADGKELPEVIEREQCRHIIVPMTRKITPFTDLKCLFRLIKIFRKEKPDIVHTHTPKAGLLGMLAAKFCGIKVRIHTVAGLPLMVEKGFKYQLLKFIEKLTYAAANHVWPNSHSLMQFISKHKLCKTTRLNIIAKGSTNGIAVNRFNKENLDEKIINEIKEQIHYSTGQTYLLCIGRLVKDKGLIELVHVFLQLQKENVNLKLILVGEYENALDPLPEATLLEIENNTSIIHINWSNRVEYFMHLADFFVFPSHREGFPNVLLQAGSMGLPVICSHITGNIDIVTTNETGLIFESGNEQQMLKLLQYALLHQQHMQDMAKKLQQHVRENYRQENIWQNMLEAYKTLVN
ncbi:MAG: glycosyltransferase family 4 protein [Chitinophagaceae bacterium]|nr:glycosyltransferase family 4 protein [Chitinophagaceae bacterium]MBK9484319.1 glycosyltransferase family 4 protein [Chitinophagaceae bacterium]MBL0199378.1 glycosyltransferase family 4 protein [Chitinophagaceae bacterium]